MHHQPLIRLLRLCEFAASTRQIHVIGVDEAVLAQAVARPLGARDGVHVEHVHGVDLLQRPALRLDHEEEDDEEEGRAAAGEDEAIEVVNVVGDEGSEEGDQEVEEPVRRRGQRHAGSAVARRVQLADDGPNHGSPGRGEGTDEQTGEDNHDVTRLRRAGWVRGIKLVVAHEGEDEEAHAHPRGAKHETLPATTVLDDPQSGNGGDDVDRAENDRGDIGVRETGGGEDGGAVVEEEVGTRELLAGLQDHAEQGAVQHARAGEDLVPRVVAASALGRKLRLDLEDLGVDKVAVRVDAVEASHVATSLILAAHAVGETGRLGHEEDGAAEEDGPEGGKAIWNTPLGAVVVCGLSAVVDLWGKSVSW